MRTARRATCGGGATWADVDAAIRRQHQVPWIGGIDPQRVQVGVDALAAEQIAEGAAVVVRDVERHVEVVDAVRPLRIDREARKVERAQVEVGARVDGAEARAAVVRTQQGAGGRLHHGVDDVRIGTRDGDLDPPELSLGQAVVLRPPLPGAAAVERNVESGAQAAGLENPGLPPVLPHRGVELAGIAGIDREIRRAGLGVHEEDFRPRPAAVDRLEHSAFGILRPHRAEGGHPGDLRVRGMKDDAGDVPRSFEAQVAPRRAAVERAVDAVAGQGRFMNVRLARAGPDDGGIRLEHRDGPDRQRRLLIEDGLPGGTAVDRLEDAATGASGKEDVGIGLDTFDRGHPAARSGGADRPGGETGETGGIDGGGVCREGGDGEEEGEETPHHPGPLLPSPSPQPGEEGAKQDRLNRVPLSRSGGVRWERGRGEGLRAGEL